MNECCCLLFYDTHIPKIFHRPLHCRHRPLSVQDQSLDQGVTRQFSQSTPQTDWDSWRWPWFNSPWIITASLRLNLFFLSIVSMWFCDTGNVVLLYFLAAMFLAACCHMYQLGNACIFIKISHFFYSNSQNNTNCPLLIPCRTLTWDATRYILLILTSISFSEVLLDTN